jgi:hypothetical protein
MNDNRIPIDIEDVMAGLGNNEAEILAKPSSEARAMASMIHGIILNAQILLRETSLMDS